MLHEYHESLKGPFFSENKQLVVVLLVVNLQHSYSGRTDYRGGLRVLDQLGTGSGIGHPE